MNFDSEMDPGSTVDFRRALARTIRRRLLLLGGIVVILCSSAAGLYAYHHAEAVRLESQVKITGIAAANSGDDARAVSLLTQYLQSHGDDAEALTVYARVRMAAAPAGDQQAIDDTISALEQLLQLPAIQGDSNASASARSQAEHRLLSLDLDNQRPSSAIDVARKILEQSPGDLAALVGKTTALMQLGEWDRALDAGETWVAADPQDIHAQMTVFDLMQRIGKRPENIAARAMALRKAHAGEARFELLESCALTMSGLTVEPADVSGAGGGDVGQHTVNDVLASQPSHLAGARLMTAMELVKAATAAAPPTGRDAEQFIPLLVRQLDEMGLSGQSLAVLQRQVQLDPTALNRLALVRRLWEMQQWAEVIRATPGLPGMGASTQGIAEETSGFLPFSALSQARPPRFNSPPPRLRDNEDDATDPEVLALRGVAIFHSETVGRTSLLSAIGEALAQYAGEARGAVWQAFFEQAISPSTVHATVLINRCQDPAAQNLASPCLRYVLAIALAQLNECDLAIQQLQSVASQNVSWEAPAADEAELLLEQGRVEQAMQIAHVAEQQLTNRGQALDERLAIILARVWLEAIERAQMQAPGSPASLERLVEAVQQTTPGEPYTLAVQIALRIRSGEVDAARDVLMRALHSTGTLREQMLAHLAQLSRDGGLHLQDACFARWRRDHGMTAELALAEAIDARQASLAMQAENTTGTVVPTTEGEEAGPHPASKRLFAQPQNQLREKQNAPLAWRALVDGRPPQADLAASPDANNESAALQWQLARARYLDIVGDARAVEIWSELGDGHPDNLSIAQLILQRPQNAGHPVTEDRALNDRTIDHLRTLTGEGCLQWRLSRSRWWIEDESAGSDQIAEGCRLLGAVLETCPDCVEAYQLMAVGLRRLNNFDGAIEQLQAARNIDPSSPKTVMELIDLLENRGRLSEAWLVLRPLTQGTHPDPAALLATGWLQEHDGDLSAAADSYQRVLAIAPESVAAENNLAMVLAKNAGGGVAKNSAGDLHRAMELARRATAQRPDSADLYDTMAFVQDKCNDPDSALRSIDRAVALAPAEPRWRIRRAEILCRAGRRQEARADVAAAQRGLNGNWLPSGATEMTQNELRGRLDALRVKLISSSQ